jgi:hypothetical protein
VTKSLALLTIACDFCSTPERKKGDQESKLEGAGGILMQILADSILQQKEYLAQALQHAMRDRSAH